MEAKKPRAALGRGLSSLISTPVSAVQSKVSATNDDKIVTLPQGDSAVTTGIPYINIDKIHNNPTQPRREFKEAELNELSESIKSKGVLQPVLVRPIKNGSVYGDGQHYEIVAGERRWRAAKLAALTSIPAVVRELDDRETLEISIIENIQRSELSPVEEAQAYQRLITEFGLSQVEVAERVSKDRASVANYLRILKLPAEVLQMIKEGTLSMGHAKAILTVKEPNAQLSLAKKVINEALSVRALEQIVARVVVLDNGRRGPPQADYTGGGAPEEGTSTAAFPETVDRMRNVLGTKVIIKHHSSGRGRIEVEYFSESELDRIVEHICR